MLRNADEYANNFIVRRITFTISLLLLCLWGASGCNTSRDTQNTADIQLPNSTWSLVSMGGELPEGVSVSLTFDAERLSGKSVCNRYFADYTTTGSQITVQAVGATRMMCSAQMAIESQYFDWLGQAKAYVLAADNLTIQTPAGELVFVRQAETASGEEE